MDAGHDFSSVIITDELDRRRSRLPDYAVENRALASLADTMSGNPDAVLPHLVELVVELMNCESAGVSLLEPGEAHDAFRWVAVAGAWAPYRGGTMPRAESPCGEVIARGSVLLMSHPERAFPALLQAEPGIHEALLAPFAINGEPAGTVWAIQHSSESNFEAEDARLLKNLAQFASAAHRMAVALREASARSVEAEDTLRMSERRFRALATIGSSSIYRMSPDWREMRQLEGAAFLRDTDEATIDWVDTYIPLDARPSVREAISRAIAAKDLFELEHRVLRADGSIGWTFSRAIPLLNDAGEIFEWFGTATDVTARVQAGRRFTRLFQASPAPFLVLKPDAPHFTIAEVNDAYLSATMRTREQVVGRGIFEAYPANPSDKVPGGVNALRASLQRVLDSRLPDALPNLQYDVERPDGTFEKRWWSPINSAVLDDDGEVEALIHNANDVSETRQAEIALRESDGRHAFLLKLSDTLRPLRDPVEAQTATMQLVVDHLQVMRATYFKIDPDQNGLSLTASYDRGAPPIPHHMRLSDFAPDMADAYRQGRTLFVEDAETEASTELERTAYRAIGVRAGIGVPLVKDGLLLGIFGVHSATPRRWSDANIQLLQDVADRIWSAVDRAQAELASRESEERQAFLLKLSDALRGERSADAIADRALRMLSEQMRLDRCYIGIYRLAENIGEFPYQVHDDRLPALPPQVRLSDFPEALRVAFDRTLVIDDAVEMETLSADERVAFDALGLRALIAATLRKGEDHPLWAIVAVSTSARSWTPSEISLVEEATESTWAAIERARAEVALRESEARYQALFAASPVPFMVLAPNAPDFTITGANDAYFAATLTKRATLIGRKLFDVFPDDPSRPGQLGSEALALSLERVLATRATDVMDRVRYDLVMPDGGFEPHWWEAVNAPMLDGSGKIIAVIHQVTRVTKLHYDEIAEREERKRQAFLLKLSDAVRHLNDAAAIERAAVESLGKELGVSRVFYATMDSGGSNWSVARDYSDGVASSAGTYPLSAFQQRRMFGWQAGQMSNVADSETDPSFDDTERAAYAAFGTRAAIGVPMVKGGRFVALLAVNHAEPRAWTAGELALTRETAERTWASVERARAETALRDSEARLAAAFDSVPVGAAVIDMNGSTVVANAEFRRFLPTDVIPSRDPVRGQRWRGWDANGTPLAPTNFPGARAMRGEHVVPGQQMLFTEDDGREIWTSVAAVPTLDGDENVTGHVCTISDIDALKRGTDALIESEGRFRHFSDASTNVLWIRDAATLRMEFSSPAFDVIYGIPGPERGGDPRLRDWVRLIEPASRNAVLANFRRVRAGERAELEFRIRRASDGALRWIHCTDFPLRDANGGVRWVAGLGADITDVKEAAERQGVLVAELQHRTRNLIAVVRSLSDRTLDGAASLEEFGQHFRLRLSAIARVQGLLSSLASGGRVTFDELLRLELAAHGATEGMAAKVTLDGPTGVALRSGTVQILALGLHELATNAVKYGAFAAPNGHLDVRWHVEPAAGHDPPRLHVRWQESGVVMPEVSKSAGGGGYGRELIERALPYQLKAQTSYELGPDGVRCTIAVPIFQEGGMNGRASRVGRDDSA